MKAHVVFMHERDPRAVLQAGNDDYFVVTSKHHVDMAREDDVIGDLTMTDVKMLFNLTRGTLINIKVLGRYVTMQSAIRATADTELSQRKQV